MFEVRLNDSSLVGRKFNISHSIAMGAAAAVHTYNICMYITYVITYNEIQITTATLLLVLTANAYDENIFKNETNNQKIASA